MMREGKSRLAVAAERRSGDHIQELFFAFELIEQETQINHSETCLSFWSVSTSG